MLVGIGVCVTRVHSTVSADVHERVKDVSDVLGVHVGGLEVAAIDAPSRN